MSRLDRHVAVVQTKLALRRFSQALAWSLLAMAGVALLAVVVDKFFQIFTVQMPWVKEHWVLLIAGGGGVSLLVGLTYALIHKPTPQQAAAAIDDRLKLKEKFSTAIFVRPSTDLFAMAAVRDAEATAEKVQLGKQFPVAMPKQVYTAMLLAAVAFGLSFISPMNLFGQETVQKKKQEELVAQVQAKATIEKALAAAQSVPEGSRNDELRKLVAELKEFNAASRINDPAKASRRALQALQEVNSQTTKDWDKAKKYAEAQNMLMQALQPPDDAQGPVGEARKEIAKGNFDNAAQKIEEAVKNFEKMDQKQKEDQAKQLAQAGRQLAQMANNPQAQQQMQQQLQQMGANQAQAQQMQKLMQQAAQGGQQGAAAQQQLQQMAQQMAQQMNNGQGANQQQQQAMQQAMQQMQGQANAQNQANALGQAAQQMAQAMQNAQQQGANGQQGAQAAQQMAQAQQQMQQALGNMQGVQQAMNQQQAMNNAAQQAMQQAQQAANGGQNPGGAQGGQGNQQGNQPGAGNQGPFANGNPNNKGPGQGGPGIGAGGNMPKEVAPGSFKAEQSPSADDPTGKILASYLVKDAAPKGEMKQQIVKLVEKAQKEAADEVDSEHASRQAQKVAQEYFRTMAKESGGKPADAPK